MKQRNYRLFAASALAATALLFTGCQQPAAPVADSPAPVAAAPAAAPSTTVVEEVHRDDRRPVVVENNHTVVVDKNHPRPEDRRPDDPHRP